MKVIKSVQVTWNWTGDSSLIKGFQVAITPSSENPNTKIISIAKIGAGFTSYTFDQLILDDTVTYSAWVQALYAGVDSSWVSTGNISVSDDGNATIATTVAVDAAALEAENNAKAYADSLKTLIDSDILDLQNQVDGVAGAWFYAYIPTLANEPAVNWTTDEEKSIHVDDLFYNTATGAAYHFIYNGTYSWERIVDQDVVTALANASTAQDTADSKMRIFGIQPVPPYDTGDLWSGGPTGDLKKCIIAKTSGQSFSESDWELASKYTEGAPAGTYVGTILAETVESVTGSQAKADAAQSAAQTYTDAQALAAETTAKAYADGIVTVAEQNAIDSANAYTDAAKTAAETTAAAYADGVADAAELAAIASAEAYADARKAEALAYADVKKTEAEAYADGVADAAETAAITSAQAYADLKKTEANAYADGIVDDEETRAIADATAKANAAQAAAEAYARSIGGVPRGGLWQGELFKFNYSGISSPNPAEVYCYGGTFIHPNGNEYTTTSGIVYTNCEGRVAPEEQVFLMYIGTDDTRFTYYNESSSRDWAIVKYDGAEWKADTNNNGFYVSFTPNPNDCIITSVAESSNPGSGFDTNTISYYCQIGGTTQTYVDAAEQAAKDYADSTFVTSVTYGSDIAAIQSQIDGNITTWFLPGEPTLSNEPAVNWTTDTLKNTHLGDIYYDDNTGFSYRFKLSETVYSWSRITDSDVTTAIAAAAAAQDTADSKRRVFVVQPIPPYDIGDLWDTGTNDVKRCTFTRDSQDSYNAGDWTSIATVGAPAGTYVGSNLAEDMETIDGAQTKVDTALSTAQAYADAAAALAQTTAEAYADGVVSTEEARAIADAQAKADAAQAAAQAYTEGWSEEGATVGMTAAEQAAYALETYADAAAALAETTAKAYADGIVSDEEARAIADAQAKADAAQIAAEAASQAYTESWSEEGADVTADNILVTNPNFENDLKYWSSSYNGETVPDNISGNIVAAGEWGGKVAEITGEKWIYYGKPIPVNTSKVYKGRFRVRQTVDPTEGQARVYAGLATLDSSYNNLTGGAGTHRYFIVSSVSITTAGGWQQFEGRITGTGDLSTNFREGTAYVRPMCIVNYSGGNGTAQIDGLEFYEDIPATNGIEDGADVTDYASIEADAQARADAAQTAAQTYADAAAAAEAAAAEVSANAYADGVADAAELAAIAAAEAYADARKVEALAYADGVATDAETAAITSAQAYADLKKTEAQAYADGIVSDEEARAIADAQAKADAAQAAAQTYTEGWSAEGAQVNAPSLGIKVNYSSFTSASPGEIFFHGFDSDGSPADIDGYLYFNGVKVTMLRSFTNTNAAGEGYIVFDTSGITFDNGMRYGIINKVDGIWKTLGNMTVTVNDTTYAIGTARMSTSEMVDSATVWTSPISIRVLPDFNATVGAPAGTYVGTNLAEDVESVTGSQDKADAAEAAAKAYADATFVTSATYGVDIADLQSQIDGSITTWFYDGEPTLANDPASSWTTTELKNNHLGDIYYDNLTGYSYRFKIASEVYSWSRITDSDITTAIAAAAAAQDTADSKRRVFVVQPITPYDIGDLWDTGSDVKRCITSRTDQESYSLSDWTSIATVGAPAGTYVGDNLAETVETTDGAQSKADAAQTAAQTYADAAAAAEAAAAQTAAEAYADGVADAAELAAIAAAEAYADLKKTEAQSYADGIVTAEEARAIADAQAKADAAQAAAQLYTEGWSESGATVGATWGTNITSQPTDSELLNSQQQYTDIQGTKPPADADKTVTAFETGFTGNSGGITMGSTAVIKSSNFVQGASGYVISGDGTAEFNTSVKIGNNSVNMFADEGGNGIIEVAPAGGTTGQNYCRIEQGDVSLYRYINSAHHVTRSLRTFDTGSANNGETVYLNANYWASPPRVFIAPMLMPCYKDGIAGDQMLNCTYTDLVEYEPGHWSFSPTVILTTSGGTVFQTLDITLFRNDSGTSIFPTQSTPDYTEGITVTGTVVGHTSGQMLNGTVTVKSRAIVTVFVDGVSQGQAYNIETFNHNASFAKTITGLTAGIHSIYLTFYIDSDSINSDGITCKWGSFTSNTTASTTLLEGVVSWFALESA